MSYKVHAVEWVDIDEMSNTNKFYRYYYFEDEGWIAHWGRIGTRGDMKPHLGERESKALHHGKAKERKGYRMSGTAKWCTDTPIESSGLAELDADFITHSNDRSLPKTTMDMARVRADLLKIQQRLK